MLLFRLGGWGLPDFGYANYFPSLGAVSETWNNKVLKIMLKAFSFYRLENRGLESCGRRGRPLLAGSSCFPVFMEGGQRRKRAAGTGQNVSLLSFLPVLSFLASRGSISRLAEQGGVRGRLGRKGGLQGRGRHQ